MLGGIWEIAFRRARSAGPLGLKTVLGSLVARHITVRENLRYAKPGATDA